MAQTIDTPTFARDEQGQLTPTGQAERWTMEFEAARKRLKPWHAQGEKILDRYLDERNKDTVGESRLNLFSANVDTQHAMLYGQIPGIDVARHFADANDDVARVASTILERMLLPLSSEDSYVQALAHALEDRLLPGLGCASIRYEFDSEMVADPVTGEQIEQKADERTVTDYHYWKDCLWSPCRTFDLARWFAWSNPMSRAALVDRFGEDVGNRVPLNSRSGQKSESDAGKGDPWGRADVWEIWSREDRKVFWFVEGFTTVLDQKDDPLGLEGFFPFPRPMVARPTTRNFTPRPDFVLAQDLYNEIDTLTTRIHLLEQAIRVAGVYDKGAPEVAKLLTDAGFNKMYPAENWGALVEKGGFRGVVDWFPLDQVTGAIAVLSEKRAEKIGLLQQVTGWSDIMRGQSNPSETLGAQQLKSQYGSVRIQKYQTEFAQFATGLQQVRAEIIGKLFDPQTIIRQSGIMQAELMDDPARPGQKIPNVRLIEQAVQLIKNGADAFRVEVKPEAINLTDYSRLKQERTEVITALGGLLAATTPLIQMGGPPAIDFVLATASWLLAGTKGGDGLEAEFDQFRAKVQALAAQPKPPPPPDPRQQAIQMKSQADMAKTKMDMQKATMEHRYDMQKLGAEVQADRLKTLTQASTWNPQLVPPGV